MKKKNIELYLTYGLGNVNERSTLVKESNSLGVILSEIEKFKKDDENVKSFKIEPFDTFHMDEKKNSIYVDFGDYRVFFGIVGHDIDLISEFNKEYFT